MPHLARFDHAHLSDLLRKQYGVVTRAQARGCEMSEKAVRYRTRPGGPWQVVLPGVYLDSGGVLTDRQRAVAAFLYAQRAIAITGMTAVAWHGIKVGRSDLVDVLVPQGQRRSDAGFVRLKRTSIRPGVDYRDGAVSYAPLDRAIADAARQLTDMSEVRDLVATCVQRGKVEVWQLARELSLGPVAGSARLRLALGEVADGVRSVAEADLRSLVKQFRLPDPLYNPKLFVAGEFLAMPDAWWPDFGVAAEVESKAWHMSPADWQRTLERQARMSAEGILVVPLLPARLRTAQRQVAREIRSALANSHGPLPHITTRPIQ
jgi:hypothetical protein